MRERVARRVEVVEIAEEEACRVPDAAVGLDELPQDLLRDAHVLAVVLGGHPEPEELRAMASDHLLRRDHVPERFRHLAAHAVEHEPVGDDGLVRRATRHRDTAQKGAVEPTAVLVAALEIDVRVPAELGTPLEDGLPARPRIEPDVEHVGLATELRSTARGAAGAGGNEVSGGPREPRVAAFPREDRGDVLAEGLTRERLLTSLAVERDHGNAPVLLP